MKLFPDELQPAVSERAAAVDNYMMKQLAGEGEVAEAAKHLPSAGGKRLRPLVCCFAAEALGTTYDTVVPIAAGLEALHVSTLVYDDHPSMDNDEERRGVPTVHLEYDAATAILAGNVLQSKAFQWPMTAPIDGEQKTAIIGVLDRTVEELCNGQHSDLSFDAAAVDEQEYLSMAAGKTAAMYRAAAHTAGIASGADQATIAQLKTYGTQLGLCFQMIDDVLDYVGEETGKDQYTDLRNNRPTIVNIHASRNGVPVYDSTHSVEERASMVREAGSISYAREQALTHAEQAREAVDAISSTDAEAVNVLKTICNIAATRLQ